MECAECGATFTSGRYDQRFCSTQHKNNYHQRLFYQRTQFKQRDYLIASNELDVLKEQNGALQNENDLLKTEIERLKQERLDRDEYLKGIIDRYKGIADKREEEIERLEETIDIQKKEIDRLKLERRVYQQEKTKKASNLTREHLERVYTQELKRQFPNDVIVQEHIGAIRSFNASYINALVTA
jgi:hypothetical protein